MPFYAHLYDTQRELVAKGLTSQIRLAALVLYLLVATTRPLACYPALADTGVLWDFLLIVAVLRFGLDFSTKRRYTLGKIYLTDQGVEQEK